MQRKLDHNEIDAPDKNDGEGKKEMAKGELGMGHIFMIPHNVIPAKAGIQKIQDEVLQLISRSLKASRYSCNVMKPMHGKAPTSFNSPLAIFLVSRIAGIQGM